MEIFDNKNSPKRVKAHSFLDWAKENHQLITTHLSALGLNFIHEHTENLKQPLSHITLDNRWHYLDKSKKQSYRASFETNADEIPRLLLTYYTFRHGGYSAKFNSKQALKELWLSEREGRPAKLQRSKPIINLNTSNTNHN